jgi:hypothetical protein
MAAGPGKYEAACSAARRQTGGRAVVVLVFDGDEGSGFSVEADGDVNVNGLPDLLRLMADDLEAELKTAPLQPITAIGRPEPNQDG